MKVDVSSGFWRQRPVRELAILKDHLAPEGRLFLFHEPLGNTAPPPTAGPVPALLEGTPFSATTHPGRVRRRGEGGARLVRAVNERAFQNRELCELWSPLVQEDLPWASYERQERACYSLPSNTLKSAATPNPRIMIPDTLLTHRSAPPLSFQRNRLTPPLKMNHHPEDGDDRPDQG
jgi:hypothetical protein